MSRHRRVSSIDPSTLKALPLADFWLEDDGTVRAEWAGASGEMFRQEIEESGIAVSAGIYRPSDGADFFNNIALAFSQSSFVEVLDVE